MSNNQKYEFLVGLAIINIILSSILFLINLLLVMWIKNPISLNHIIYTYLGVFLLGFEVIRLIIILISDLIILLIKNINIIYKALIITSLLFGTTFSILFLIRILGFACFTPVFSFLSVLFIYIASVKIIIFKHDNNRI